MADDFLGPGFVSMSPDFSSTWVVRTLVILIQIVIIKLHRAIHELKDFATIIEELILILREGKYKFTTKRQNIPKIKQDTGSRLSC